jgi:hypothetical protein
MKHKHHIIPKHMGGTDEPSNLIELTVEEHADAHKLLWEEYGKKEDLLAWLSLSKQASEEDIQLLRSSIGGKNNRGSKKSEEHRKKISESLKLIFEKFGRIITDEQKEKLSVSMTGNKNFIKNFDEDRRKKFSERMKLSHKENPRIIEKDKRGRIVSTKSGNQ